MKCEDFRKYIYDMDGSDMPEELKAHVRGCKECAALCSLLGSLKPDPALSAPETLKRNILEHASGEGRKRRWRPLVKVWYSAAAVLVAAVGITAALLSRPDQARAAISCIDSSLANLGELKSMVMRLGVRTLPGENFSSINAETDMTDHTLMVLTGTQPRWRLDKGGRVVACDGVSKRMWFTGTDYGFAGTAEDCFEEWFSVLIDPRLILLKERETASRHKGVRYDMEDRGGDIVMIVKAKARGDFTNSYMKNTSIEESDTRREYVFDKATSLLKSLRIYALDGKKETLVVGVTSIEYNVPLSEEEITALPEGYRWVNVNEVPVSAKLSSVNARQAAELLLEAFGKGRLDEATASMLYTYDTDALMKTYGGSKTVAIGKPFRSGLYAGVFVPCKLILPNGKERRINIALRNDNANGTWVVDGGI